MTPIYTDRSYWELRGSKATVSLADELLELAKPLDSSLELKYNKYYIGVSRDGRSFNFVTFIPKKNRINLEIKIPESDDVSSIIEDAGIDTLDYDYQWGNYRLRLTKADIGDKPEILRQLMQRAYERRAS